MDREGQDGGAAVADNWDRIIPFFQFQPEMRKAIYTTNATESLHRMIRNFTRNRRIFANDEAARKALFLAIESVN